LRFWNDTNTLHTTGNYIELQAGAIAADRTITLPIDAPADGDVLTTLATGVTSWSPSADLGEFIIVNLPLASTHANSYALVTDAGGSPAVRTIVRSDGTNWKVVATEGATVA